MAVLSRAPTTNYSSSVTTSSSRFSTTSSSTPTPTGILPNAWQFDTDKGTKWNLTYIGDLNFTNPLGSLGLRGDNCRTGKVGNKVIWTCGDMQCGSNVMTCGFATAPGWYGTSDVMLVNTANKSSLADFNKPWSGDPQPPNGAIWGMWSSNVAPINETHGVIYARAYWRNGPYGNTPKVLGNTVSSVTLGPNGPIATRVGPFLTSADYLYLGVLCILRDGNYIYQYSGGGPSNIRITRVPATDDVFDASKYEYLVYNTTNTWAPGLPLLNSTDAGALVIRPSTTQFSCGGSWGSVVYNRYLAKYLMLCGQWMVDVNMYVSDTPWGPWSSRYKIASGGKFQGAYGSMIHPEYSPLADGSDKSWYFSIGPNKEFFMYRVDFGY
ncbi:hypothetical protein PV08_02239 [Exophiala spinifera]|uniref:DUF4185 domain-containing protein n=1 Tax=Exophiala spinifera TaxID=91928 RepID=A0A0D2CDN7_9EURO|nr:uncharacterized protein PV08_02239 [Exophiala spinifera]KIW21659.1 hypothetical protein PV08_02239 [Exophiala spinifera]